VTSFLSEVQRLFDEERKRRVTMLTMPLSEQSERFTVIADLGKTGFFRDMKMSGETGIEDEWRAELLDMSYESFVEFIAWVWGDAE
jgi:hypothetical protein